jgi:hypothetical protein
MEQNSVNTTPQPPSAFMPRKCACAPGRSAPGPAQCEVCQKRLRVCLRADLDRVEQHIVLGISSHFSPFQTDTREAVAGHDYTQRIVCVFNLVARSELQ